jgi:iron complex outermembrane receptor protein
MTRSDAAEVGLRVGTARVAVSLSAFATLIDRESLFDHVSGTNLELDGTRRLGGELTVTAKPRSWLELRADVTAVDARFDVTGNPVPGAPRLLAQGEAHLSRGPWRGGVHAVYVGARPLAHGATGAATAVVDALVGWQRGALELGLQLDNVLGQRWFEGEYHFASRWDRNGPAAPLPKIHYSAGRPFGARLSLTYHL